MAFRWFGRFCGQSVEFCKSNLLVSKSLRNDCEKRRSPSSSLLEVKGVHVVTAGRQQRAEAETDRGHTKEEEELQTGSETFYILQETENIAEFISE